MHTLARPIAATPLSRHGEHPLPKTMLFATQPNGVPYRLRQAIKRELPWAVVAEVHQVRDACVPFRDTVSIILADTCLLEDIEKHAQDLRRLHPLAPVVLIDRDPASRPTMLPDILNSRIIRGILPLNTASDLMISVIAMILRGGEYFPRRWLRPDPAPARSMRRPELATAFGSLSTKSHGLFLTLTRRELEILRMVAQGLQNKAIAAALNLSEHTVKIHIHNISSKLGAHNRTQASAMFRDYREASVEDA
jgi:DNA-binding NarL/FixJ family response regulator